MKILVAKGTAMRNKFISKSAVYAFGFLGVPLLAIATLSSANTFADDNVDDVTIQVPTSCGISSTVTTPHTASISLGTYLPDIGTTSVKVLCNDTNGFSIYATGFTGDAIGEENSNRLLGTGVSNDAYINTGTATSGETSNWAMKLSTDTQATYPLSIATGYDSYHSVPNEWTKVATRLAATDAGQDAEGSEFATTYAAYINLSQPADVYTGKVKYILVHPHDNSAPSSDGYMYVYDHNHGEISFSDLTVTSYDISDTCMESDYLYGFNNEQRTAYCNGEEVIMDEGQPWEWTRSIELDIMNDGFVELYEEDVIDNIIVEDVPGAVGDYRVLGSEVFFKYSIDNFMDQYICTMYNANARNGEPACFENMGDENMKAIFNQDDCDMLMCEVIDAETFWICASYSSSYCEASNSEGRNGIQIVNYGWDYRGVKFYQPEVEAPNDLIYYNDEPLSVYFNDFWKELENSCWGTCSNSEQLDSRITAEKIDNYSGYLNVKPFDENDLTITTKVVVEYDDETGDSRVITEPGSCTVKPNGFNYGEFTYHGAAVENETTIRDSIQGRPCQFINDMARGFDYECFNTIMDIFNN